MEKVQESKKKLFNPKTMVKYDHVEVNNNRPLWVCKFCLKVLLSELSAMSHHATCKPAPTKRSLRIEKIREKNQAAVKNQEAVKNQAAEKIPVAKKTRGTKRIRVTKNTQTAKKIRLTKNTQMAMKIPKVEMVPKTPKVEMAMKTPKVESDNNVPPYICLCCNYVFGRKVSFEQHLRLKQIKEAVSDEEENTY
ncbi:uncharacterized protein LOC113558734 [Rhopalosiphum maidis]|uniref:uncharacterized protein LOC113558734 n=1 Tax=Rhopalosiphum maidis TaxID=43146 RepID=UPI000EFE1827|nr:uncharacterized protein LOC113558734 [Rhopalosiphum maidis]